MKKFYITTPIYYVNDKPHLGHAYTTIAADVLARYCRMRKEDVFFLTGTDEHGAKVAKSAEKAGKKPQEFCDEMSAYFLSLWNALNISNDDFIRTTERRHKVGVRDFMLKLKESGAIYEDKYEGLYCTGCENFITEKELINGKCPHHMKKPEKIVEKNYFFRLNDYLDKIKDFIKKDRIKIQPANMKSEVLGLFKQGLEDFSVSREKVKWGISVPWDKSQVIYVWVEALQNYLTGIGYGSDEKKFKRFWSADLQLMAKDIIKFHAIYWPAMLLAAGLKTPKEIFAHGFFTIDEQKMSKTLGNIIDPNELVKKYSSDGARYLILSQFPFGQDGDIKAEKFDEQYNADLANGLGNLISRVAAMYLKLKLDKKIDVLKNKEIVVLVENTWKNYEQFMEALKIDQALKSVWSLIKFSNEYITREEPWELLNNDVKKAVEVLYNLIEIIRHIAWMLYPFMPGISESILTQFSLWKRENKEILDKLKKWRKFDRNLKVGRGRVLFPRA